MVGQVQRFPVVQRIARGCLCQNLREGRLIRVRLDAVPVIRRTAHPGADNAVGQGSVGQREINVRMFFGKAVLLVIVQRLEPALIAVLEGVAVEHKVAGKAGAVQITRIVGKNAAVDIGIARGVAAQVIVVVGRLLHRGIDVGAGHGDPRAGFRVVLLRQTRLRLGHRDGQRPFHTLFCQRCAVVPKAKQNGAQDNACRRTPKENFPLVYVLPFALHLLTFPITFPGCPSAGSI